MVLIVVFSAMFGAEMFVIDGGDLGVGDVVSNLDGLGSVFGVVHDNNK